MTLKEALEEIAQYVRDTKVEAHEAVKAVWNKIAPLPEDENELLVQQALAARVGPLLRDPTRHEVPEHIVSVRRRTESMRRHDVTVQLLADTIYHVNGVAKPVTLFTRYDILTKISSVKKIEEGVSRHRQMFEYVYGRLTACKKDKVEDLAEGEQLKIARMVFDLRQSKTLPELAEQAT